MNKFLLLAVATLISSAAAANTSVIQIVDANGNDVSNTTINVTVAEENGKDPFFGQTIYAMHSNLSVKNISNEIVQCRVPYNIMEMTGGKHSICFGNCVENTATGEYEGQINPINAGETMELRAEYFPVSSATEGKCVVEYSADIYTFDMTTMGYVFVSSGPKVTVNYLFGGAGVDDIVTSKQEISSEYYDLSGRQITNPENGLYIKRTVYNNGSVENTKVLVSQK